MLSSSLDAMSTLSKTTSPQKLVRSDCTPCYKYRRRYFTRVKVQPPPSSNPCYALVHNNLP